MFHQIRSMMAADDKPLSGEVEVDETYMHPKPQKRPTAKAHDEKVVFGMVERGSKAKVKHVKSAGKRVLMPEIQKGIKGCSVVYGDEARVYNKLPIYGYPHSSVNHSLGQYVNGSSHPQNVENLWSNMKRGIKGVYGHVGDQHVHAYIDEYAFRYSYRNSPAMFWVLRARIANS